MGYIEQYIEQHPEEPIEECELTMQKYVLQDFQQIASDLGWSVDDVIAALLTQDLITYPDGTYEVRC